MSALLPDILIANAILWDLATQELASKDIAKAVGQPQPEPEPPAGVLRGMNQGSRIATQGFSNIAGRMSRTCRARKYSRLAFRHYKILIPLFYPTGVPISDTLYNGAQAVLRFQHALEYPYAPRMAELAPRKPTTWGGLNFTAYDRGTYDGLLGYLESDLMDFGAEIPADAFYGEWLTVEVPAPGTNVLPYTMASSNFLEKFEGVSDATASQIAGFGGGADVAITAASIPAVSASQAGVSNFFMPSVMLMLVDPAAITVGVIGDSIAYGVGEGVAGSGGNGDARGSALGNAGWLDRMLYEHAGLNALNLGKGSDRLQYLKGPDNWKYRRNLLRRADPGVVIMQNAINDIGSTTSNLSWTAATAYAKFDAVVVGGGAGYLVVTAGLSGAQPPAAPSTIGDTVTDGSCSLRYLGASAAGNPSRRAMEILGRMAFANDQLRQALPDAKIIQTLPTPSDSSTDAFATTANQTPSTGWGAATTSIRGFLVSLLADPLVRAVIGIDAVFDPNPGIEDTPQTSKWVVNGAPSYATADGIHPNSTGAALAAAAIPAGMIAASVT